MKKKSNIEIISNLKILKKYPTLKELKVNEIEEINPYDIISNSLYLKYIILDEIFGQFHYKFSFTRLEEQEFEEFSTEDIKKRMKVYLTKEKQQEIKRIYQYTKTTALIWKMLKALTRSSIIYSKYLVVGKNAK